MERRNKCLRKGLKKIRRKKRNGITKKKNRRNDLEFEDYFKEMYKYTINMLL